MDKRTENLFLSPLLSDGMVLQRNTPVKIWGKAAPYEQLTVTFRDKTYATTADSLGNWLAVLEPMAASGPWELKIAGKEERIIKDVLVGDVWVLGGQSNMELPVNRTLDLYEDEVKTAGNRFIREFAVPLVYDFQGPREELSGGKWKEVTPDNVLEFSAVGYFFATALYEKYRVPIGLIRTAVGGTPIEAWMSEEVIRKIGGYEESLAQCKDEHYVNGVITAENERMNRWYQQLNENDAGYKDGDWPWSKPSYKDIFWDNFTVPGSWEHTALEGVNGSVWFRKKIEVPEEMLHYNAVLRMGTVIDADETYVNGILVGKTEYRYPPRKYPVPKGVLQAGPNTIAVRVISNRGTGGFVQGKPYCLQAGPYEIDLTGAWKYKIGARMEPLPQTTFFHYKPCGVYNGMIAPLKNYGIKGVLWYQGESNTHHPDNYHILFQELIANWRSTWQLGDFPFLYVQLANFMASPEQADDSNWAKLREEQRLTLAVPNTAMAVTIDVGEENDLHPQNKKPVGYRLALCAEKLAYHQDLIHQGPLFSKMEVRGQTVELSFDYIGGGLMAKDGQLKGFELCGKDRKFYPADAEIIGDKIRVYSKSVKQPVGVRYAWADNPQASLYNKEDLPASPFQAYHPGSGFLGSSMVSFEIRV